MSSTPNRTADLVSRYMILTKEVMPQMARNHEVQWPVQNDHCFQRIVLDAVCNGQSRHQRRAKKSLDWGVYRASKASNLFTKNDRPHRNGDDR